MNRNLSRLLCVAGALILVGAVLAQSTGNNVPFPKEFRNWIVVNSMIVTKDSPIAKEIGGLHIVHLNPKGMPTFTKGGPFPYPDGTVFADDVHEFSLKDGSYVEGDKKVIAVMVKDSKKYPITGGWGFQVWTLGESSKPLVPDTDHAVKMCFQCHTPQKNQDFTFSTYIP